MITLYTKKKADFKRRFEIGDYKIHVQLIKRRGASPEPFFPSLESLKNVRSGSRFSRFFRHVFERGNIRAVLGGNLAVLAVVSGVVTPNIGLPNRVEPEISTLSVGAGPITTEVSMQYPVSPVIVNQGYRLFHPGVDLDGVTGDPVKPIMKGRVLTVERASYGYGNSIIVQHANGLASRYAHLSKVSVKEGEEVETRSVIGAVGSTGRSTGDHLHLEVYKEGKTVNPLAVLPK